MNPVITRHWGMPSADTFDCPPIEGFVKKYLMKSKVSVDPFARNRRWATFTNDINPNTSAEFHMDAADFLAMIETKGVKPDLVIFDPPYSPRQVKEMYESFGKSLSIEDSQMCSIRKASKNPIQRMVVEEGYVLSFGWNSAGMGKNRGFEAEEIMIVCHGAFHNDTICVAERKLPIRQRSLFEAEDYQFA